MSDFNLFSSKTDVKKLLFATEKFKFDEQCSNDSWQDLPGVTPTSVLASFIDNQHIQTISSLSSFTDNRNDYGWETLDDYSTIPKSYGFNYEQLSTKPTSYCRLDRRGHWLLLPPPPPPVLHTNTDKDVTYNVEKHVSKDSCNHEQVEQKFPDSYESLTVSIDFHVPTDEVIIDYDTMSQENILQWKNKIQQYQNKTLDDMYEETRCIKPNHGKVANQFDEELVQEQLRYNGILEISYIRNQGWPVRFTFEEFLKRYKFISYPENSPIRINAITCEKILKQLSFTDYVIGKSKIFLKLEHLEILNQHYEQYIKNIIICQKVIKGFLVRRKLLRKAKQNANERHVFLNQVHCYGKKTLEKLVSLPKVSTKSVQRKSSKTDDSGRLSHFIKKRSKHNEKSTSPVDEAIPMSEQEHNDMLKAAIKLQLLNNDEMDELNGVDHRITSNNALGSMTKTPGDVKSSLEGLSECEVRIFVQDEFTPETMMATKQGKHKKFPMESNIQLGSGLACTTTSQNPLKVHDGTIAEMAAKIPIAPTMDLASAKQLIRQTEVAATSGDLFMTDWSVGQEEKKTSN